ncbi:MAG: hypothetical protein C5B47_05495 [Verrucomicrobia bacterium]|nr:MAG: hypothetical protein C5B47_05495 [Verrucomicrobiota bacterium]
MHKLPGLRAHKISRNVVAWIFRRWMEQILVFVSDFSHASLSFEILFRPLIPKAAPSSGTTR